MPAELPAVVPGPVPPDDSDAWYAPDIRAQYHVGSGVVATVREAEDTYYYRTREPFLSDREAETRAQIESRFEEVPVTRPRTREGAIDRMADGLPATWDRHLPGLADHSPGGCRRLAYHLGASLRALGELTPLALDTRIRIGDTSGDRLTVHTRQFAPAVTDLDAETPHLQRFLSERIDTETVPFLAFEIPVMVYRRKVLGADRFHTQYDVREPERLPGDAELIGTVVAQLLETPPDRSQEDRGDAVLERARTLLRRELGYRDPASVLRPLRRAAERVAGWLGFDRPRPGPTRTSSRVDDLAYYVARELVGDGPLTVPLRDPRLRSIEVTDLGDQITVLPHRGTGLGDTRMPATVAIDGPEEFRRLARSLATEGGVEISADRPTATVDIDRPGDDSTRTHQCSVSLPSAEGTAHISITSERATPPTPIDLLDRGVLDAETVAAIWTIGAHSGIVVFVGPARAEPTAVMAAHVPFIPPSVRPVSVTDTNRTVALPQETGIRIQHPSDSSGAPTTLENGVAIDSDMLVLPDIDHRTAMERFGTVVATGRGVIAAARASGREFFVEAALEAGLSTQALEAIDLLVELPDPESDERATAWTPDPRSQPRNSETAGPPRATHGDRITWIGVGDPEEDLDGTVTDIATVLSDGIGAPGNAGQIAADFERRRRYVEYLRTAGVTDRSAFLGFLADLRTDEAATVERIQGTLEG